MIKLFYSHCPVCKKELQFDVDNGTDYDCYVLKCESYLYAKKAHSYYLDAYVAKIVEWFYLDGKVIIKNDLDKQKSLLNFKQNVFSMKKYFIYSEQAIDSIIILL